ncbi:hypothetical protein ACJJTC_016493 [Scirpophaga incertulas]
MKCDKCGDNATDGVECSYCQCFYHFACAGIAETSYRKMGAEKKASWRSVKCRTLTKTDPSISDILQELKNLREEIGLETRLLTFENRITTLETKVFGLEFDLEESKKLISTLQEENQSRVQHNRMNNLEISGIPFTKGENLNNLMFTLSTKAGISLNVKDLDSIHRVRRFETKSHIGGIGNKTASTESRLPAIIVKFTRRIVKDQLLAGCACAPRHKHRRHRPEQSRQHYLRQRPPYTIKQTFTAAGTSTQSRYELLIPLDKGL